MSLNRKMPLFGRTPYLFFYFFLSGNYSEQYVPKYVRKCTCLKTCSSSKTWLPSSPLCYLTMRLSFCCVCRSCVAFRIAFKSRGYFVILWWGFACMSASRIRPHWGWVSTHCTRNGNIKIRIYVLPCLKMYLNIL